MTKARLEARLSLSDMSDQCDMSDRDIAPSCPKCGKPMKQRMARIGTHAGESFWGCTGYPKCNGISSMGK